METTARGKTMAPKEIAQQLVDRIHPAIQQFGEYTFHDKGLDEIVRVDDLMDQVLPLAPTEACEVFDGIVALFPSYGVDIVRELLSEYIEDNPKVWNGEEWMDAVPAELRDEYLHAPEPMCVGTYDGRSLREIMKERAKTIQEEKNHD
jgi:hypothetical protein